jgi:hypothetical protein
VITTSIAIIALATAIVGMIAAAIHAYGKWLEYQIIKAKTRSAERFSAKTMTGRIKISPWFWVWCWFCLALLISGILWCLLVIGITRVSIFYIALFTMLTSVLTTMMLLVSLAGYAFTVWNQGKS